MSDSLVVIGEGKRVTLHFSVSLMDGSVVDTTKDKQPATFNVGDGNLLPGFEQSLFGLKAGDRRSIFLQADQAFGQYNEKNVQSMPRSRFEDMDLQAGLMLSFADPGGGELPGVVKKVMQDTVIIDFNHPLAGSDLTFDVEIINVVDASAQPVKLQPEGKA
ncbi:MAG: peptidylprolyl isomerase [Gammaproteobacteria bacterium]|nr:MAG: peptidylprolyl isomerase [Gammaproteobacteria bacterium]